MIHTQMFHASNFVWILHSTEHLSLTCARILISPKSKPCSSPFFLVLAGGLRPGAPHRRQAETLYRRDLAGSEAVLGANPVPETLTSMNNLGMLLWNQGQLDEAGPRSSDGSQGHFVGPGPEAWIFSRFPILSDYVHFFFGEL